jgi:hypothetical protein
VSTLEKFGKIVFVSAGLSIVLFLAASLLLGALVMMAAITGHNPAGFVCGGAS